MSELTRVLSLGAGVQSTTVFLLSCRGLLPKLDAAVFADTGWEPVAVYEHLDRLKSVAANHGIPLHVVSHGNIKEDALRSKVRGAVEDGGRWASMPYRTRNSDGSVGMIRRQCTSEYKIQPIEKFLRREIMGLAPRQRAPQRPVIEQWFGISTDESQRMKPSRNAWATHYYPLIDMGWSRGHCLEWLRANYPHTVPRSACIACPFKSNHEWRRLRDESPKEWREAVEFDRAVRDCGGMRGQVFVHRDAVPLEEADIDADRDQIDMFGNECEGMCGV